MPNWCSNTVKIKGTRTNISKLRTAMEKEKRFLDFFKPQPRGLVDRPVPEGQTMPDWWNWRVNNWGTKWEIALDDESTQIFWDDSGTGVEVCFDSAWAPPLDAFAYAMEEFDFEIELLYYEPGMCFAGKFTACRGVVADEYFDDLEKVSDEVDAEFHISESLAEWQKEQADEQMIDKKGD